MEVATICSLLVSGLFVLHLWLEAGKDVKFKQERNHQAYLQALRDRGIEVYWHSDKFMTHEDFVKIIKGL